MEKLTVEKNLLAMQIVACILAFVSALFMELNLCAWLGLLSIQLGCIRAFFINDKIAACVVFAIHAAAFLMQISIMLIQM